MMRLIDESDAGRVLFEQHERSRDPAVRVARMDMHCHSRASSAPVIEALRPLGAPESYSEPERVYEQARARGMDFVTITDHDSIDGVMELVDRGFQDVIVGEEVSVYFPEDRCKLHVLVWGLTPAQHEELARLNLRDDVYQFAHWLHENNLAHSFAHPLYVQNGRLRAEHLERAVLLFKGWETLNGAHAGTHRGVVERYIEALTPAKIQALARRHGIEPLWVRSWDKAPTAGSDDHALMNVGQTWAAVECEDGRRVTDPREFLRRVMAGKARVGGQAGHSSLLAHQLTTVGVNYFARRLYAKCSPRGRYVASKLGRFAGVAMKKPPMIAVALDTLKRKITRKRSRTRPLIQALRSELGPVLEKYPDLRQRLDPSAWKNGAPVASHERMAEFTGELCAAVARSMSAGALRAARDGDTSELIDHVLSYAILQAAQLPYVFSLFHQNKERPMLEKLEHHTAAPGSGASVLERPMRVALFTDTLGDVNGVSRFIQNVADQANKTGRDLQVFTSTRMPVPGWANIRNFEPVFAAKMPKYEQLEFALPPMLNMLRCIDAQQPDVIHISTPGPVGVVGYIAARMLRVPVLGVYHTDFPAYIDRLFDDHAFTAMAQTFMRFFYKPFRSIFTRSEDYVDSLVKLGMAREKMIALMPGLETAKFNTGFRDSAVWDELDSQGAASVDRSAVKVLYVGRVSVEKNMPMLSAVWKQVAERCAERGVAADLVVVGDGPYRRQMAEELAGTRAHFLGFRHGRELSTIYASSDLFVFPSTTDTLGQVVMESQSSGLPVIVTDQGGPKEVVRHGETGFVLSADDAAAWVATMVNLAENHAARRAMGRAATESMRGFDISRSFEHFWDVHTEAWHEALAERGITRRSAHGSRGAAGELLDDLGADGPGFAAEVAREGAGHARLSGEARQFVHHVHGNGAE